MGYILPITQHTYVNYHVRMLENKKSPYYVGGTYKVLLNEIQPEQHNPYTKYQYEVEGEQMTRSSQNNAVQYKKVNMYNVDRETGVILTGKGKFVNQQI